MQQTAIPEADLAETASAFAALGSEQRLTVLRTFLHIGGIAAMFTALKHLPLADAIAIA